MNRALWRKNWLDARLVLVACCVVVFGFCWLRMWILSGIPSIKFSAIVEQLWDRWEQISTVPLSFILTYDGRVSLTFVEPIVTFTMAVWAITRGSDVVSGELGRGSMEMLLAQPVSRTQVLATQAATTVIGCGVISLAVWAGVAVGLNLHSVEEDRPQVIAKIPFIDYEITNPLAPATKVRTTLAQKVDAAKLDQAVFNLFSYGVCLAGLTTLMSAWDVYRWRTIGIGVGLFISAIVLKLVGMSVKSASFIKYFSFLTPYEPERFCMIAYQQPDHNWTLWIDDARRGLMLGPLGGSLILLGIGLAAFIAAGIVFERRDIPAPL